MLGLLLAALPQEPLLDYPKGLEQVFVPVLQLAQEQESERRPAEELHLWLPRPSDQLPPLFPLAIEDSGWSVWTDHNGQWALGKGRRTRLLGINLRTGETRTWLLRPWGQRGSENEFQRAAAVAGLTLTVVWSPHFQGFVVHRSHQQLQHYDLLDLEGEVEEIGVRSVFPADALFLGESGVGDQVRFQFTHGSALWRLGPGQEPRVSTMVRDLPYPPWEIEPDNLRTILAGWCIEPGGNVVLASATFPLSTNSGWNRRDITLTRISGQDGVQLGHVAIPRGTGRASASILLAATESSVVALEPTLRLHVLPKDFEKAKVGALPPPIPMTYSLLPSGHLDGAVVLYRLPKDGIRNTMLLLRD